jgi:hypothetical protein
VTGLVGIYTDPKHVILYTSNGEARQEFSVVYTARPISGTPTPSSESREVTWAAADAVDGLAMDRSMRARIQHYLDPSTRPVPGLIVGPDGTGVVDGLQVARQHRRVRVRGQRVG